MRYTSSRESIWQRILDAFGAEEGERLLDVLERSSLDNVRVIAEQLRREFEAPHIDQADVPGFDLRVNRDREAGKPGHGPCYTLALRAARTT